MKSFTVNTAGRISLAEYIPTICPIITKGQVFKLAKTKKIRLNDSHCTANVKVGNGDILNIYLPDEMLGVPSVDELFLHARPLEEPIYEDENLLIVNKPAGLAVIDEEGKTADTLINRARLYLKNDKNYHREEMIPHLCHRLDTGTSGLVIIAKNKIALEEITVLLKTREIEKTYYCITVGKPRQPRGKIETYLQKNTKEGIVSVVSASTPGGKRAITNYETVKTIGRFSLVKVELITGRTHQIRVHMAHNGTCLLGDSKYGDIKLNRELRLKYQLLSASSLKFPDKKDGVTQGLSGKTLKANEPWFFNAFYNEELK